MKTVNITAIISEEQVYELARLIMRTPEKDRVEAIKQFLLPFKEKLDEIGILREYLAWALYSKFIDKTLLG